MNTRGIQVTEPQNVVDGLIRKVTRPVTQEMNLEKAISTTTIDDSFAFEFFSFLSQLQFLNFQARRESAPLGSTEFRVEIMIEAPFSAKKKKEFFVRSREKDPMTHSSCTLLLLFRPAETGFVSEQIDRVNLRLQTYF